MNFLALPSPVAGAHFLAESIEKQHTHTSRRRLNSASSQTSDFCGIFLLLQTRTGKAYGCDWPTHNQSPETTFAFGSNLLCCHAISGQLHDKMTRAVSSSPIGRYPIGRSKLTTVGLNSLSKGLFAYRNSMNGFFRRLGAAVDRGSKPSSCLFELRQRVSKCERIKK